ncbi:hypothetical protein V501_04917 [Pseudogymnoascus sp. VKM F-4519 (FW-2642)]|nr:hypothetical protein V501_04917 [Pseudogymnoascus sp. VKM F-4519 (FW-2642)]
MLPALKSLSVLQRMPPVVPLRLQPWHHPSRTRRTAPPPPRTSSGPVGRPSRYPNIYVDTYCRSKTSPSSPTPPAWSPTAASRDSRSSTVVSAL